MNGFEVGLVGIRHERSRNCVAHNLLERKVFENGKSKSD
jgi:hypothetical protein